MCVFKFVIYKSTGVEDGLREVYKFLKLKCKYLERKKYGFHHLHKCVWDPPSQKKDKSIDSHALPQLNSPTMAVANICVDVNNSPTYTHSPGVSSQTLGHSSLSPSHDVSLLFHKFTYPKLNCCPVSPNQLLSQSSQPLQNTLLPT